MKKNIHLQIMVKITAKIFHSLLLLIVGLGLTGINVSKLYCIQCEEIFLQVKLIPQENECPCEHGCTCCDNQDKGRESGNREVENIFYKVTDFSQTEQSIECAVILYSEINFLFHGFFFEELISDKFLPDQDEFPDLPPSPEWLCTYRC